MKLLAIAFGLIVAAIGVVGVATPSVLLEFGRSLQTTNALYIAATARVIFGAILVLVAPASRTPRTLRFLGVFIVIAGLITPLFGVEQARAMFDWWSTRGSAVTRVWAMVAVAFGAFVVYAVATPRRSST